MEEMTYDEALARVEQIVASLERSEAISVSEYKERAAEAKRLLDFCESEIVKIEKELCE